MRGKLVGVAGVVNGLGIIPAHAGQTGSAPTARYACPDHPRACGANFSGLVGRIGSFGSSPRMRGKRP